MQKFKKKRKLYNNKWKIAKFVLLYWLLILLYFSGFCRIEPILQKVVRVEQSTNWFSDVSYHLFNSQPMPDIELKPSCSRWSDLPQNTVYCILYSGFKLTLAWGKLKLPRASYFLTSFARRAGQKNSAYEVSNFELVYLQTLITVFAAAHHNKINARKVSFCLLYFSTITALSLIQCFSAIFFCDPNSFKSPICKNNCDPTK